MDSSCSPAPLNDVNKRALTSLLEAFGAVCSQQEIASAFCRAGRDVHKTSEILCQLQEKKSNTASLSLDSEMILPQSEKPFCENNVNSSVPLCSNKGSKPKKLSSSVGTVSCVLGKAYVRSTSSKKELSETKKPLKLEVDKSFSNELDMQPVSSDPFPKKERLSNGDIEEFLFSMLGEGFKLSRDVIREVLGHCGYDASKGVKELLALSAKSLEKGKTINYNMEEEHIGESLSSESCISEEDPQKSLSSERESSSLNEESTNLSRQLLVSLFTAPDRSEEEPKRKRLIWGLNRTRVIGQKVVTKPPDDIALSPPSAVAKTLSHMDNDEEDNYEVLRRAVKQHWDTMKAYYDAAVDAFSNGDREKANYCMEQGKFYNQLAREADEKSNGEILEPRKSDAQDEIPLDLHAHSAREAVRLLKLHLHTLANIPSFRYLKVIVDADAEDKTKGKRKRLVLKLLERESIRWTEEDGSPGTILIQLDEIDRNKLSFGTDPQ